jgi:hypothetical protein
VGRPDKGRPPSPVRVFILMFLAIGLAIMLSELAMRVQLIVRGCGKVNVEVEVPNGVAISSSVDTGKSCP